MLNAPKPKSAFGHVFLRNTTYWIRYRVAGVEYRESSGSTSRNKAEQLLGTRAAELRIPGAFVAPSARRTRFEDLVSLIRGDYALHGRRSAARLENALARLGAAFAGRPVVTITRARLNQYMSDRRQAGAALSTIRIELNALGRAMRLAEDAGRIAQVPPFPTITLDNTRTGFFEEPDLRALVRELPAPLRPLIEFLAHSGWRRGEAVALTWSQVDFVHGTVRLEPGTTKSGEGRTFPFGALPPLRTLLERQRAYTRRVERRLGRVIPHVFHRDGRPIGDFHKVWARAIDRAAYRGAGPVRELVRPGLVGRLVHDLRRTAARNFRRAGLAESDIMELCGWETRAMFKRYAIRDDAALAVKLGKAAATLPGATRGTTGAQSGGSRNAAAR